VDRSQLRLALLLAAPENRIFLVGDDDQTLSNSLPARSISACCAAGRCHPRNSPASPAWDLPDEGMMDFSGRPVQLRDRQPGEALPHTPRGVTRAPTAASLQARTETSPRLRPVLDSRPSGAERLGFGPD